MSWSWILPAAVGVVGLCACGRASIDARGEPVAALTTKSALIVVPPKLNCSGQGFCRETVLLESSPEIQEEVASDCDHLGGTSRSGACSRHDVVATCAVDSGEHGPVYVLTYAQVDERRERENVSVMSELCEKVEGTFELARR